MGHLDAFRLKDISECTPWTLVQPAWRTNIALSKCKHSCTREGAGGVFSGCDLECLSSAEQYCTRGCYTHANYHLQCAVRCQCSHLSEAIARKQWQTWTTKTKQTEKKNVMSWRDGPRWSYEQLKVESNCESWGNTHRQDAKHMAHFLASHAWDLGFHAILRVFSAAANAKFQKWNHPKWDIYHLAAWEILSCTSLVKFVSCSRDADKVSCLRACLKLRVHMNSWSDSLLELS